MAVTLLGSIKSQTSRLKFNPWLTFITGSLVICAWTFVRFFNRPASFDQVGQLVLAHQWLHGQHGGAVIGPTNYILKLIFLYMPVDIIPVSAQLKLIVLTLAINIATFGLLIIGIKLICEQLHIKLKPSFNLQFIFLALICGSVFWISFSNSRNLEVAGGVFLVYIFMKILTQPTRRYYELLILLASILFFADPLQIYMTLLPLLIYSALILFRDKNKAHTIILVRLLACSMLSIVAAKLIVKIVERTWNVSFISADQSVGFKLSSIKLAAEQMAKLYAGGYESGHIVRALNLIVVLAVLIGASWFYWRKRQTRPILLLGATFWLVDIIIYILNGQAHQADTNRYLIMTVPAFILVTIVVLQHSKNWLQYYAAVVIVVFNVFGLSRAFAKAWDPSFGVNAHDRIVINYIESHHYSRVYASMDTALASDYLSGSKVNILPLVCAPDHVVKESNLFFDKSAFGSNNQTYNSSPIALVLDGNNITNSPSSCRLDQISKQLGSWQATDKLMDGSIVLLYNSDQFKSLRGFYLKL